MNDSNNLTTTPSSQDIITTRTQLSEEDYPFFRGTVVRLSYRDENSGFSVVKAVQEKGKAPTSPSNELTTVVGVLPGNVSVGMSFIARGEWQTHPRFGMQFKARSFTETMPVGIEAISNYLASGAISGLGPVLAERILQKFGDQALEIIDKYPDRLKEVSGIGKKKLREIKEAWQEKRNLREVQLFFQNYGISLSLGQRIYNAYGERSIEVVSTNPYILAKDVWGIGFQTADRIAQALGLDPLSVNRIAAGLSYVLQQATDDGHCYLPKTILFAKASSLLGVEDDELFEKGLQLGTDNLELSLEDENVFLPYLLAAEEELAKSIASRIKIESPSPTIDQDIIDRTAKNHQVISSVVAKDEAEQLRAPILRLSEQQQQAVALAASSPLLVITGGPGCGKTTVVRAIASMFRRADLRIKLAAPTGRAAQRLAEVCEIPASTIHRLLKFDPISRQFLHDENDLLPVDALIIDESSMIDIQLASSLFKAIPKKARIVIVGDADQLPSVGPGLFLADLLELKEVPRVKLNTLFRRATESAITTIAHHVNNSIIPEIPQPDGSTKSDAYFLPAENVENAASLVEKLIVEQIPKKFGFSGSDIIVLTPMNQGPLGVISLNQRLQARLVPVNPSLPRVKFGNLEFRLGDRVIQRVNNYNIHPTGVFNGDQGEVVGIDTEAKSIVVKLWDNREVVYPSNLIHQLDLAYALTIHRSQGSEVPAVVLALHDSHNIMLEKQLIYTGITRAKKLLVIVGTRKALAIASKRCRSKRRYTKLAWRIMENLTIQIR